MEENLETLFKSSYTTKERDECINWFEARLERLPATVNAPKLKGFKIKDLPKSVKYLAGKLKNCDLSTSVHCGEFAILLELRRALLAEHPELK
ncbi:MAG: hypothetical protein K6F94_02460 [Bacteroidaceae bacterium]|nr:hypothetical protein [Bacteroidaceae bacterium]